MICDEIKTDTRLGLYISAGLTGVLSWTKKGEMCTACSTQRCSTGAAGVGWASLRPGPVSGGRQWVWSKSQCQRDSYLQFQL